MDPRWCTQEERDTNGNQHGYSLALAMTAKLYPDSASLVNSEMNL
jgi:hypothetical protein